MVRAVKSILLKTMTKRQIRIEHNLNSTSKSNVWELIGTPHGLARWVADEVEQDGERLVFMWGDSPRNQERREALVQKSVRYGGMRWCWTDDDADSYVEISMQKNTLTGQYALVVVDFALPDEVDLIMQLWHDNFKKLRMTSGV